MSPPVMLSAPLQWMSLLAGCKIIVTLMVHSHVTPDTCDHPSQWLSALWASSAVILTALPRGLDPFRDENTSPERLSPLPQITCNLQGQPGPKLSYAIA